MLARPDPGDGGDLRPIRLDHRHFWRIRRQSQDSRGGATGDLTIGASSLDTGHNRRDRHLRSPGFFDAERHPHIVFTAAAVTAPTGIRR
jgi:YceI-like domain